VSTADPFTTFRFEVVLDLDEPAAGLTSPLCDAAFAECDGLEMTMEPKTVLQGGLNRDQVQLIGPVKYSQVTLRRGMTANLQLWSWFALAAQTGRVSTAHGEVTMWNSDGTPAVVFSLQGCLPVKMRAPSLNARDGLVAVEELALVCRRLTVSAPGATASVGFGISADASFSLGAGGSLSAGAGAGGSLSVSGGADLSASAGASAGFQVG